MKLYQCRECGEVTSKYAEESFATDRDEIFSNIICPFCGGYPLVEYKPDEEFLTVREFAKRMKLSESGVYSMVNKGRIPCHRVYSQIRLRISDFEGE